jgi:hypothetical protein
MLLGKAVDDAGLGGMLNPYIPCRSVPPLKLLAADDDDARWYSSLSLFFCRDKKWCFFSFSLLGSRSIGVSAALIVAVDELARLYSDEADDVSIRLVVLKFALCSADSAEPSLPGLGRGFSSASPFVLILRGREKSFTLDYSDWGGFAATGWGFLCAGGGAIACGWVGWRGDDGPEREKTTLAAAVAAAEWLPSRPLR